MSVFIRTKIFPPPLFPKWKYIEFYKNEDKCAHYEISHLKAKEESGSESESHSVMSDSWRPCGLHSPWNSPGQNTGVGSLCLLQGIFPTQGSNPGLAHCRWILYQLNHKGSPWKENLDDIWKQRKKVKTACITMWDSPCEYYDRQTY